MSLPGWVAALTLGSPSSGQVQPAGVDLRVGEIHQFLDSGFVGVRERKLAESEPLEPRGGRWLLEPGVYKVVFGDVVHVPSTAVGLCFPRSSLLRSGVYLGCAVWDPGYYGRGEALLHVLNPHGFVLEVGARVAQLVYIHLVSGWSIYRGQYLGERVSASRSGKS